MQPKPPDPYLLEVATDPRKHELPSAGELLAASLDAVGKGVGAGLGVIASIANFIIWTVIFLVALHFLLRCL